MGHCAQSHFIVLWDSSGLDRDPLPAPGPTGLVVISARPTRPPASPVPQEPPAPMRRCMHIVDHEVHDGLGHETNHEVPHGLVDNGHIEFHQALGGLHLPHQLWVHGVHEAVGAILLSLAGLPWTTQRHQGGQDMQPGSRISAPPRVPGTLRHSEKQLARTHTQLPTCSRGFQVSASQDPRCP